MADWLRFYGPALLAWAFIAGKLYGQLRRGYPSSGTVWLVLVGLACSLTLQAPGPYRALSSLTGVPNIARLVSHLLMLVVVWSAQALLSRLSNQDTPLHRYRWGLAVVAVVMSVLFWLAPTPVDDVRFAGRYAAAPWVLEYWLVFLVALAPAFYNVVRLGWRYSRLSGTDVGRLGLRLIVVGAASSLVYHVHKAVFFAARRFSFSYPEGFGGLLDRFLPLISAVTVLVGATLPLWGSRVGLPRVRAWFGRYRTYVRLRPLWLALYQANPQIALVPPRPALVDLLPHDLDLRLYRRVIEIRDGRLVLQPYLDPQVGSAARAAAARSGVTGRELDAIAEAATLAAALSASRDSRSPAVASTVPGGRDLESDTAFLNEVARAYRRRSRLATVQ
jgi:hypothetical protein